jgi:hypothetical protein
VLITGAVVVDEAAAADTAKLTHWYTADESDVEYPAKKIELT